MRIERLELQNFRGFDRREITFTDQFTVLIGDNGSGKTSILDGIAVGLGAFLYGIEGVDSRNIQREEIRREKYFVGEVTTKEPQLPVRVACFGEVEKRSISWYRKVLSVTSDGDVGKRNQNLSLIRYARELLLQVSAGQEITLPLIAYYGTDRLHGRKGVRSSKAKKPEPGSRMEGYLDCLDPSLNWRLFESWFFDRRMIELQRQTNLGILESVRTALRSCVEICKEIDYDFDDKEVLAELENGNRLPFRMLSDGVRNMLGLVADMAYRMATLNPQLRDQVVQETPGVVLIDELDLHLHPVWQRKVVEDLKRTFPNVQFIVTTHSPFIVQSLSEGELRWLQKEDDDERVEAEKYVNRSLEDIAENVMEIPFPLAQRSHHLQNMYEAAQQYYDLLDQAEGASPEEIQRLKQKLDELSAPYSDNVAYYAFLERKRLKAGLGRDDDETD